MNKNNEKNNLKKSLYKYLEKSDKEEKEKEIIKEIKECLPLDIIFLSNKLTGINNFDEISKLNDYLDDKNSEDKKETNPCSACFFLLFCASFQLIAVQEMIIILNAILNELIDELKLSTMKTPREYNFYEVIKICSFKEIPDFDVILATSFIGKLAFNSCGFTVTNIVFQLIPGIFFFLFFFLFSFHTGKELERNYELSEILILLLTYALQFILVGGSSIISLNQINNEINLCDNSKEKDDNNQNFIDTFSICSFFFQSCLSIIFTILLNKRVISILDDNINQKNFLYGIAGISLSASFVSTFFSFIHSYIYKKKNKEIEKEKNNHEINIYKDFPKSNSNQDIQVNKEELNAKDSQEIKKNILLHRKVNINQEIQISIEEFKSSENQEIEKNEEESKRTEREDEEIKEIKTCIFCGYLFFQKTTKNKKNKKKEKFVFFINIVEYVNG